MTTKKIDNTTMWNGKLVRCNCNDDFIAMKERGWVVMREYDYPPDVPQCPVCKMAPWVYLVEKENSDEQL